jgi:SET domain-containing protein
MEWTEGTEAIALGNINLLNHSVLSNVSLTNDFVNLTKSIHAKRDIKLGEELTLNYDCKLWFDVSE